MGVFRLSKKFAAIIFIQECYRPKTRQNFYMTRTIKNIAISENFIYAVTDDDVIFRALLKPNQYGRKWETFELPPLPEKPDPSKWAEEIPGDDF